MSEDPLRPEKSDDSRSRDLSDRWWNQPFYRHFLAISWAFLAPWLFILVAKGADHPWFEFATDFFLLGVAAATPLALLSDNGEARIVALIVMVGGTGFLMWAMSLTHYPISSAMIAVALPSMALGAALLFLTAHLARLREGRRMAGRQEEEVE